MEMPSNAVFPPQERNFLEIGRFRAFSGHFLRFPVPPELVKFTCYKILKKSGIP